MSVPLAFLSHSSANKARAGQLAKDLRSHGVEVWYDTWEIGLGDSLRRQIELGLEKATHFIVLLTPESIGAEWVNVELDAATVRKIEGQCKLLPVLDGLKNSELPLLLRAIKWVSLEDYAAGLGEIVRACHGLDLVKPPLGAPPRPMDHTADALGLTPDAARLAEWLNRSSEHAIHFEFVERDELLKELSFCIDQARDTVSELEDLFLLKSSRDSGSGPAGFSRVSLRESFFWDTDPVFQGSNPADDAVAVAAALVNVGLDRSVDVEMLMRTLGWPPRRMNPALTYLVEHGYAKGTRTMGSHPFVYRSIFSSPSTSRFAKKSRGS